jgi:hypothetical protein
LFAILENRFKINKVSIELPKYTISTEQEKHSKGNRLLMPVFVIICLLVGYFTGGFYTKKRVDTLQQRNSVLEEINTKNQDKLVQLQTEISQLKTEQKVKREAALQMQNEFKIIIDKQKDLESQVSFYERLLSPNIKNKGLRVFESQVKKKNENNYKLRIILVQKLERAREINGRYQIEVVGIKAGTKSTIEIKAKNDSKYKFKYFENISLDFSLAIGFKADQLVVKLFPSGKKSKTIEYKVDWQSIIQ